TAARRHRLGAARAARDRDAGAAEAAHRLAEDGGEVDGRGARGIGLAGRLVDRHRGRRGGRRGGGARGAGLRRDIACGVIGRDGVGIRRGGQDACVCKGGRARRGDLDAAMACATGLRAHGLGGGGGGVGGRGGGGVGGGGCRGDRGRGGGGGRRGSGARGAGLRRDIACGV